MARSPSVFSIDNLRLHLQNLSNPVCSTTSQALISITPLFGESSHFPSALATAGSLKDRQGCRGDTALDLNAPEGRIVFQSRSWSALRSRLFLSLRRDESNVDCERDSQSRLQRRFMDIGRAACTVGCTPDKHEAE